jgi:hypothetical protein
MTSADFAVIIAAVITSAATIIATIGVSGRRAKNLELQTHTKLDEIHVMVNSRLTAALKEIAELKKMRK